MSILYPARMVRRVTDITRDMLEEMGVSALILDVDNTLTTHNNPRLEVAVLAWLAKMREADIALILLSNNSRERVRPFAEQIRLGFVARGMKPLAFGYKRAVEALGVGKRQAAVVGDQIFTDTLGGNLFGVTTILLDPIKPESSARFKFKRRLERAVFKIYKIKNTEVR